MCEQTSTERENLYYIAYQALFETRGFDWLSYSLFCLSNEKVEIFQLPKSIMWKEAIFTSIGLFFKIENLLNHSGLLSWT